MVLGIHYLLSGKKNGFAHRQELHGKLPKKESNIYIFKLKNIIF